MIPIRLLSMVLVGAIGMAYVVYKTKSRYSVVRSSSNNNSSSSGSCSSSSATEKCFCGEPLPQGKTFKLQCGHEWHVECLFVECLQNKKNCRKPNCSHTINRNEIMELTNMYGRIHPHALKKE